MAQLLTSPILLTLSAPIFRSPRVDLAKETALLRLGLQRPTTIAPLNWNSASTVRISLVFVVDGREHRITGQASGGIRLKSDGQEADWYQLIYDLPLLFDQKARDYLTTATKDANGYYFNVPLTRLGETGTTVQGYIELERMSGEIQTVLTVSDVTDLTTPVIPKYHNSVAIDTASNATEQFGDGVLTLNHTASGSNRAAFIAVGARTTTTGAGTTSYAGGGGSVISITSLEDTGNEALMYTFYKLAPDISSQTVTSDITATTPSDHFLGVITMTGVDQTTPTGTPVTNAIAFDTSPSVTVSDAGADDMIVDFLLDSVSPTIGADQTSQWAPAATSYPTYYRGSSQLGTADDVMSWTHTGSAVRGLIGVAFKAAAGGGSAPMFRGS